MEDKNSRKLFSSSVKLFPGGVNSPVRAFGAVGGNPVFIKKGKGAYLYDEDENSYIDFVNSWGPLILGHGYSGVIDAVKEACENGLTFGAPTRKEKELGELISSCMPSMELMRLVSSGTEAVMSAVRVARGYTRRDKIVKFKGCYHGHSDGMLVKAGSGALTASQPDSAGVPQSYIKHTLLASYNNETSVTELFQKYGNEIAAVVIEPVAANMGLVSPASGFLEFLRDITKKHGSLLIFDEVITGFRLSLGGAQEYFGVVPDLTTLGKITGGGMPMGVYGGRKEIMDHVSPSGAVYQAGTLSGNPVAVTAGIATIHTLMTSPGLYDELERKACKLESVMKEAYPEGQVVREGSLLGMFFSREPVIDYETAAKADTKKYARYFRYLLDRGIYVAPSQFEIMFLSAAHTDEDIKKTGKIITDYFREGVSDGDD